MLTTLLFDRITSVKNYEEMLNIEWLVTELF
jgi:hypothetical protein